MPASRCDHCGSPVPPDAPGGVCPSCVLRLALGDVAPPDPSVRTAAHDPTPSIDAGTADLAPESTEEFAPPGAVAGGLANYELLGEVGAGGMGVVYKARQRGADRVVALKMIRGAGALDARVRERFRTEARALARLQHPDIVQVYEVGEGGGVPFFSLEFVDGGSLARKLRADGTYGPAAAAELVRVLAGAVAAAHRAGVLHRDIKPANVLLTADGRPKVTDFGLARWLDADDGLTGTGAVLGTPSYMAPEQAAGRNAEVGPRSDVYGLGATLYEVLTGKPPFRAETPLATLALVVSAEPQRPRAVSPDVPEELEAICLKCLEKAPARRYETAEALAADLGRWLRGDSTVARPLRRRQRALRALRRRRWQVAAVVVVLALTGGAFAAARYLAPDPEPVMVERPPPDPDAVVKEYARELAAGRPVTLIGATGEPRWHRWRRGKATLGLSSSFSHNGTCQITSRQTNVLELLPDVGCDRYRVSAEFYFETRDSGDNVIAIMFGYQTFRTADGTPVERFFHAGPEFHKDKDNAPVRIRPKNAWVYHRLLVPEEEQFYQLPGTSELRPDEEEMWRRVVVEVSPGGIRAFIGEGGAKPVQYADLSDAKIRAQMADPQDELDGKYRGSGIRLADWNPRAPLGVMVRNAIVAVRNVVVEPLDPKNP